MTIVEKKTETKTLPTFHRTAEIRDIGLEEDSRTVELVWSTGHKGLRQAWQGSFYEELSMDPKHVDLSRLEGAPLLNNHDRSVNSVIGVIEKAWVEKGEGKAKVRFASDADSDKIYQKVKEKVLRQVSVGYQIQKAERRRAKDGEEFDTLFVNRWSPQEISIVAIGFDPKAQIRAEDKAETEVEITDLDSPITQESTSMSKQEDQRTADAPVESKIDVDAVKTQAAQDERQRGLEIRSAVQTAGLDEKFAEQLIKDGKSLDESRKAVFEKMADLKKTEAIDTTVRVDMGKDEKDKKREAVENAILNRVDGNTFKLDEGSREFRGMSLIRIAEALLGGRKGLSDVDLASRAMTTSDLPLILANIAEKALQKRYELAPATYDKWVRKGTLKNFKQHSQMKIGDFPSLSLRNEEGEFTYGSVGESKEVIQMKKYGKILAFSEEMLIDDDMGALADFVSQAGVAARRLESNLVYSVLSANADLVDGDPLFHANHGNLGTAGAPSETTFDEAMKLFKAQTTIDGLDYLDLSPRYALCGPLIETTFRKFLSQIVAAQTSNVNIFANSVELIVDPRITNKYWTLTADPSQIDTVSLYKLEGREQPTVSTRNKWESGAFEIKIEHAAAAGAMDHRGMVQNPYT
jgi:HK97 family phage prohead protease